MSDFADYLGERIAARYDESSAETFRPDGLGPAVDFLAGLAASEWTLDGHRNGARGPATGLAWRRAPRHRPVASEGLRRVRKVVLSMSPVNSS
ncbi:hypothetical protein F4561_001443 [Lipingzhangella halophila]|uniref:Uncharacterized protein n=1 Tax=Lipingzhangella halophila TaxID=1783352 RepID=A0A7W7RFD7_9ACTN|nr:hypothetical protein [Lipingzhangella halophila]MBB4930623.1 hypothetical protein [Lipingzhangella halophila]